MDNEKNDLYYIRKLREDLTLKNDIPALLDVLK